VAAPVPVDHADGEYRLRLREACQREEGDAFSAELDGVRYQFFFLCGCFKSGTNWIGALLNLHPKVLCRGEFHFQDLAAGFGYITTPSWFVSSKEWIKPYAEDSLRATVRTMMLASTRDKPGARWLGDRTPRRLTVLLPGAPHVYTYRDGRDVLVSWAYHWARTGGAELFLPGFQEQTVRAAAQLRERPESFANNPSAGLLGDDAWVRLACREWAERIRHDLDAAERLPREGTPVLVIRYEDLHSRFDEIRRGLYEFLDLDLSAAGAPSDETKTLPGFQSENPAGKHRKGVVGDWRNYFDARLTRIFKDEAGAELVRLGYERSNGWGVAA
jgi:hypothetical protein